MDKHKFFYDENEEEFEKVIESSRYIKDLFWREYLQNEFEAMEEELKKLKEMNKKRWILDEKLRNIREKYKE